MPLGGLARVTVPIAKPKKESKMKKPTIKAAITAALLSAATGLSAAVRPLPTPPTSPYPDAESSVCVPLDPSRGPLMRLQLATDFTPSNAVIVAFGTDADNDGDLSPEETDLRVGCDCGVVQVKVEGEGEQRNLLSYSAGQPEQGYTHLCSTSTSDFDFVLKQPSDVSRRYDLAKVTTHNLTSTNLVVTLSRVGTTILVR